MDPRRHAQRMQIPTPQQYLGNGVPFRSFSPTFVPDGAFLSSDERRGVGFGPFGSLSPSVDVDRSLSDMFSNVNISPETYANAPPLLRNTLAGQIGSSVASDESFVHPLSGPRVMHSDFGVNDPFNHRRWCENMEALRRHCSSGFDYGFDFDQNSNLCSTKFVHSTQYIDPIPRCSPIHSPVFSDNKMEFHTSDDYNSYNSKFQNQNHGQNQPVFGPWSLNEIRGRIFTLAKDQNGCKILQALFENPTFEEIEIVLSEVVDLISDLMIDQFGNYLVQKLVPLCNDDQKLQLILSLTKVPTNIILVCMNPHGTKAVQRLLENLKNPNQVKLVMNTLHHGAAALARDPNGHHVIQYCLVNFNSDINKLILNEIANECYTIATDRSGCCVLQACVEHSRGEVRTRIVSEIMVNSINLAEDPFGNYVLQHMVGLNIPEFTSALVRQLQGNFANLSCNKYASNVVEKCLTESGDEIATRIILELIRSPNSSLLLVDPFANFVIQSALKVAKGFVLDCLGSLIFKNISCMRTNLYGKKILEKFEKKRVNFA